MIEINPAVLRKVGIEREAEHAFFKTLEHGNSCNDHRGLRLRLPHFDDAVALRVEHASVGRHGQFHRVFHGVLPLPVDLLVAIQNYFPERAVRLWTGRNRGMVSRHGHVDDQEAGRGGQTRGNTGQFAHADHGPDSVELIHFHHARSVDPAQRTTSAACPHRAALSTP